MQVYPTSAEEKLGFAVLRARLEAHTRGRLGQERLAAIRPYRKLEALEAELARVAELQEAFRFDDPVPLDHLLDVREVLRQAAPEGAYLSPDDLTAVRLVLITLRRLQQYFGQRGEQYPHLAQSVARITPMPDVEERIAEVVDDNGGVRDDASPELRHLRRLIVQQQAALRESVQRALRDAIARGYAVEEQPTLRNGRMVIPVRAEAKRKIQGFVQDVSATGQTVYIEPAASLDLNNEVRELESEERREVERILRALTSQLRSRLDAFRADLRVIAQFDLLQAKALLANELDAVVPQLNEEGLLDLRTARNPVLLLHFRELASEDEKGGGPVRTVVPLDLQLGGEDRVLIITGPNAGGKTVAMKTVGLFALMVAYGLPVPVDPLSNVCLFSHLIVDIGDEQSIEEDLSTFSSHVANLKYMLRHADAATLVLIDEAGTGTDPAEGGALAQAVLERLLAAGARVIATTHHGTLKVFAHETEGVANGSMQFDQETLSPTYRFQAQIPGSSYAFEIAERIGLHADVLGRARALVGRQKTALEELIASFEQRNQALEAQLEDVQATLKQAEHERQQYAGRAEKLRKEQETIRSQALEEAERIVKGANAQVERTIREIKEAQAEQTATQAARAELERYKQNVARRRKKAERRRKTPPDRSATEPERPEAPATAGPIRVGDQVVVDGGTTAAEVLEIDGREAVVALGSMRVRARLNRLQKVGGPRPQQVTVRQTAAQRAGDLAAVKARSSIDLRGFRVEEALQEVTALLDEGLAAGLNRVEILHGTGTGALRVAIREYLAGHPDVASYDEAPWDQGGPGVTYVTLK